MGSLPKTLPANFFDSSDSLPKTLPANFFDNGEQQTPLIPTVATPKPSPGPIEVLPKPSPGPSMQQMDWVREQARRTPPPPPPPVAAAQAPLRPPTPIPANPLQAPTSAIRPEAPGNIAPTVVTSPTGQSAPPIPGRIPGMERLGGKAPGVPRPAAQINETNAPSLAGDVGGGFVRGVASGAMAVPRALSRVPGGFRDDINSLRRTRADIEPNLGFRTPEQVAKDDARLRQISNSDINRFEQAALPAAPVTGAGKFAEALGSTAPYMAAGVAGPAGPAALGILAGTEESLGRSDASGIPLTDAQRLGVGAAGAAIGSTEALPFGRLLGRLKGAGVIADAVDETQLVKQLFPGLKDYAVSAGKQAIEEGVQEGTSNVLQDVTEASYGGRPVNRIGEGLGDSVTTGGGVGALVDVLTTLAGSRAGRARLSQNGVDPVALMAWVQANEKIDPMQAEFNTLARENRAPNPPQAVPQAAPTPIPAESPAPAPPQQAEVPAQVPPPPAGFTVDPLPGAIESAPAAAPVKQDGPDESQIPPFTNLKPVPDAAVETPFEPPAPPVSKVPAWAQDAVDQDFKTAEGLGIVDRVAELAAEGLVADQIAREIPALSSIPPSDRKNIVRAVRTKLGIPSIEQASEFEAWKNSRKPVPAPGPREEVVQPETVDAADPVAEEAPEVWRVESASERAIRDDRELAQLMGKAATQEPDAPLSPEVAAPPSAVDAAAPVAAGGGQYVPPEERYAAGDTVKIRPDGVEIIVIPGEEGEYQVIAVKKGESTELGRSITPGARLARSTKNTLSARGMSLENIIAAVDFAQSVDGYKAVPGSIDSAGTTVSSEWRRKGIASDLYRAAEDSSGSKVRPASVQSDQGKAFVDSYISRRDKPSQGSSAPVADGEPDWKPVTSAWYAESSGQNDFKWKVGDDRWYEVVPVGNEGQSKLIRRWDGEEEYLGLVEDLAEASQIAKEDAAEMRLYEQEMAPDIQQPVPAAQQAPPVDPGPVEASGPTIDRFHAAYQKLTGENYGKAITLADVQQEMAITDPAEFTRMLADIDRGPGITSDGAKLALPASTGTKGNNVYRDGDTSYYGIRFDRDTSPANPGPVKQVAAQNFNLEGPLQKEAVKAERPLNTPPDPGPVDTGVTWQDKGKLRIRTEDLAVDPIRFQYKVEGIGQGGVTSELKEVEGWDDDAAGTIFVWKDPKDGKTYVVNGHHRYDLARRLGQPDVGIKYIDAPDAQAARAAGALQNIREGKGSAIDAAKFLRDTGKTIADLKAANITVKGQVAKDGAALANLAPSLFDDVVHGNLKQDRAAIIGEGLDSYDDQKTVLKLADQKKATNAELREMIRLALAEKAEIAESREGDPVEDEYDLFGNKIGSEPRTTIYEKSQLSNYIQQRLRQEGKMFGMVGTESAAKRLASAGNEIKAEANKEISDQANQALAAYNKETLYSGPITDLLRQGAERIANGEKADAVKESVYASVRDRIAQILPKPAGQATAVREADAGPVESSDRGVQEKPRQRTVVKTKDGLQESIVSDIEARESQIAARNDRTRPLAEVPFSLVAEEAPQPTGPDERQESMFGDDNEIASYAPGVESVASKASKPSSPRPPAAHGSMVSRSAIVKDLSAILNDIPIRQGLFREPGALGIFKTRQGVIRTKKALDLPTIAHEIGHAIHKRIWGIDAKNPNKLNSGPLRKFKKELGPLDYDPQQSRPFEGFAEYIRLALTEPATAQKRAPYFHTWFQGVLAKYPEMSGTLDKIADRIQDWEQQPAPVKLAASINVTPDENSKWANFKKLIGDLDYEMVNEGVDLAKFDPAAYVLYRLSKSSFTRAHFALTNGTVSPTKDGYEKNGDSLQDIIRPIAQRNPSEYNSRFSRFAKDWKIEMANDGLNDFRMYLAAKRLQDYHKKDLETGWTDEQLKEVIDSTTTPAIIEAAEKLQSFQNRILDYVVEKGSMSAETADWIRANNEFYVPLYRVMDEGDGKGLGERKMLDITSPVRQRKGSQREIIDPLESIVRNTYAMYSFADRNEVSLILFKNTEKRQDQGYLFESGIVRPMKRTEVDLEEIKPTIIDSLEKSGIAVPKNLKFDSIAAVFKANLDPQRSRGIVRIIVDGQVELVQMAPQLIRALDSMDRSSANILIKILSVPAKGLTFGAVTGNPEFAGTNWMRDQFTAGLQSRNRYIPFVHGVYGVYKMITDKKLMQEFVLNGGASAALMPLSRENLRLSLDQLSMTKTQFIANHPTHLLSMLKDVLTYAGTKSEIATRFAEYSLARGRGKSARESVLDSKDVTLDFDRMGRTARVINKVIPFFAVSINGIGRFAEMHNPRNRSLFARAMVNGAALSAASLALWWVNKDDEEWKKQPAWLRDFFWLIPTKDLGLSLPVVGPFIPIPKPPIWGQVYGSSVERLAERLYSKNKHAFDGYGNSLLQTLTPPAQLQALRGAYEVYSNHVSFTDRPLETQAMRNRSSQYRYTEKTSEIAKKVSNDFNYIGVEFSPVQVEHLMYSYGAGLGKLIVNSTEELSGARANRPAMGPRDRPITRIFSTDIEPVVTENYLLFEKRLRKLEQKQGDAKFTGSASDGPTPPELSDLKKLTSLSKQFSKIRAQQHKNSASIKAGKMTREQARDANDSLARTREAILKRNKHLFE